MSISHDLLMGYVLNARPFQNDPHVKLLMGAYGHEGYGLYMALLGLLVSKNRLTDLDIIQFCLQEKVEYRKIHRIIFDYGLFQTLPDGSFHSEAFSQYKEHYAQTHKTYRP